MKVTDENTRIRGRIKIRIRIFLSEVRYGSTGPDLYGTKCHGSATLVCWNDFISVIPEIRIVLELAPA